MGQKRMLWNIWRRYEVKTYTIMNASPVPFSASNSSGALDTERFLFMAWNSSFRISFEFLSDFNSSFSRAILVRYSFSARSNDSPCCVRLSCNVAQLVQVGSNEVLLSSSVTSMHPSPNPTKFQNNVTEIHGRWTEFH